SCAFLQSAREETFERLFDLHEQRDKTSTLVLAGCMSQLYPDIAAMIPEVDIVTGIDDIPNITKIVTKRKAGKILLPPRYIYTSDSPRIPTNSRHTGLIKIADGCNNGCTYCSIPVIRGSWRERTEKDVLLEAEGMLQNGFKELVFIAQDTTFYGERKGLISLLEKVDALPYNFRARVLYLYPSKISETLLRTIKQSTHIAPYLDIPLQHISDSVLAGMKRHYRQKDAYQLLEMIGKVFGDAVTLRTTFISGFPGEKESDFKQLMDFINKDLFDFAGIFHYSKEQHTAAYKMRRPPLKRSQERFKEAEVALQESVQRRLHRFIGKTTRVLFEGVESESLLPLGRTDEQAPDIDGETIITNLQPHHKPGDFFSVKIQNISGVDFIAEIISE
ncbi:MiaB/RimO family radical SAM methylthiotransferase, partial [bacterium]|nr:MiaB/RimO family radical SAM methylthiotransferase [bacterium]